MDRPLAPGGAGQLEGAPGTRAPEVSGLCLQGEKRGQPGESHGGQAGPYQADAAQARVQHGREGLVVVEGPACVGAACGEDAVSAPGGWGRGGR